MNSATGLAVHRTIEVAAERTRAFDVFVNMTAWWPLDTHTIGAAPARASVVEPHAGGRWYAVDANGDEQNIGRVVLFEPPARIVLTWEVGCGFTADQAIRSELEIHFTPISDERTRIDLEHRHLETYGERAEEMRTLYDGDEAWTYVLGRFAAHFA